jgi:hypothetical protein
LEPEFEPEMAKQYYGINFSEILSHFPFREEEVSPFKNLARFGFFNWKWKLYFQLLKFGVVFFIS